jgi:hypothetical protein
MLTNYNSSMAWLMQCAVAIIFWNVGTHETRHVIGNAETKWVVEFFIYAYVFLGKIFCMYYLLATAICGSKCRGLLQEIKK